jgi:phosphate transport system substrate-binding protein
VGLVVVLLVLACRPDGGGPGVGQSLDGSVEIDGSSTLFPVAEAVAEAFQIRHPDVQITVGFSGTGGGFERFCRGEIDVATASRAIHADEIDRCRRRGVAWTQAPVAYDGISLAVNRTADFVDCLTLAELRRIWAPGSRIGTWSQVRPGFPDLPLRLYGAGTASGTFDHFTEAVVGEEGASRSDYQASEDDNVLVQGVLGDEGALAYFGYAYAVENRDRLRILGVDGGDGCVTPSPETIADGRYAPLARPLAVYVRVEALQRPEVAAFVDFLFTVAPDVVPATGYLPLEAGRYARLRERVGG